ncbi:copper transport protein ATOX1 isoform X2 [Orussus abietinus]|uniref:copper transport protein ATOX1 isoform X2 n=1 Tax=Orussus abietinus TaxID=222816 RepID=UPI00062575C7|nr:copper transport protein ATOX1 isoform X2 [Orussus abietinus]
MATQTYVFDVEMTCEGCSNAVQKVLCNKAGIDNVTVDLPGKKVLVTSTLSSDEILSYIKKTGSFQ